MFLEKMLHMTYAGLEVPVRVVYDLPTNEYRTIADNLDSATAIQTQPVVRRSKNDYEKISQDAVKQKSSVNFVNNSLKLIISGKGKYSKNIDGAPKQISTPIGRNVSEQNGSNKTSTNSMHYEYLLPTLDEQKKLNTHQVYDDYNDDNKDENRYLFENRRQANTVPPKEMSVRYEKYPTPAHSFLVDPMIPSNLPVMSTIYSPYLFNSIPQYYLPSDIQRQYPSPVAQYFPIVIRDPFQSILNYFSDLIEYGPTADVCQRTFSQTPFSNLDESHSYSNRMSRSTRIALHKTLNKHLVRKLHMRNDSPIDYSEQRHDNEKTFVKSTKGYLSRTKRNPSRRESHNKFHSDHQLKRNDAMIKKTNKAVEERPLTENPQKDRSTDVGPQITKLIVRRGGVAIAGAGGIATAGSGGTAIVGAGGTAFTTPASSGGVAVVGPGGKVIKVSDLTNVLSGRADATVAATGAGPATFTSKNGEVFTTSANTGGMALVTPGGKVLGISDAENFEKNIKAKELTKELQVPVGARLLTTGPIIYYNPIYPQDSFRK